MAVPSSIVDLNVAAASNSPAGADTVASNTGPDEYFRAISAIVRREQAQATATASATTVDLGAIATGNYVHITGTTTITGFGTVDAGIERTLVFDGALTLTHNSTSLILPGGANITTAAGDVAVFRSEGAGNWRCVSYISAALGALVGLTSAANKVPRFTGSGTAEVIDVDYGTYTPTISSLVNISTASIPEAWTYTRIGSVVSVAGVVLIDIISASTSTSLQISLPISSAFTSSSHANGFISRGEFGFRATAYTGGGTNLYSVFLSGTQTDSAYFTVSASYQIV